MWVHTQLFSELEALYTHLEETHDWCTAVEELQGGYAGSTLLYNPESNTQPNPIRSFALTADAHTNMHMCQKKQVRLVASAGSTRERIHRIDTLHEGTHAHPTPPTHPHLHTHTPTRAYVRVHLDTSCPSLYVSLCRTRAHMHAHACILWTDPLAPHSCMHMQAQV